MGINRHLLSKTRPLTSDDEHYFEFVRCADALNALTTKFCLCLFSNKPVYLRNLPTIQSTRFSYIITFKRPFTFKGFRWVIFSLSPCLQLLQALKINPMSHVSVFILISFRTISLLVPHLILLTGNLLLLLLLLLLISDGTSFPKAEKLWKCVRVSRCASAGWRDRHGHSRGWTSWQNKLRWNAALT